MVKIYAVGGYDEVGKPVIPVLMVNIIEIIGQFN